MENSIARDYVSEKVYDALVAGCIPIYLGAPNVNEFIPHPSAILNYAALGSVQALVDELEGLALNETAYNTKLEWKQWPVDRYSPGKAYQHLFALFFALSITAYLPITAHCCCSLPSGHYRENVTSMSFVSLFGSGDTQ